MNSRSSRDAEAPSMKVGRPLDWDKATSAAYLRLLGATQQEAADHVGIGRVQVCKWESSPWWSEAVREAKDRWLSGLAAKARHSVEAAVPEDPRLAMQVLERLEPALNPKATVELQGGANPVQIEVVRRVVE